MQPKLLLLSIISTLFISSCCTQKGIKENAAIKAVNPCTDIIEQIVTTSPKFIEFTKDLTDYVISNGGKGYNYYLDGSPVLGNGVKKSDMYDYKVTEEYDDRSEVVARFSFDPRKEKLYEYDIVENELKDIEFDKSLLSSLHGNCEVLPYEGKAYFLSGGKLYLLDLVTKEQKELNISDQPILDYRLSPSQRYLAFEKEIVRKDCHILSSLVFYDLLKGKAFKELGGKDGMSGSINKWESDSVIYSLVNKEKGIKNCFRTSFISGKTRKISEEEYNKYAGKDTCEVVNPYNDGWAVKGNGEKLSLLHIQKNEETDIPPIENRKFNNRTVQWLDHSRFVYAAELPHEAECAPVECDIYIYDTETKSSALIVENAVCFDLQSKIPSSNNIINTVMQSR